MKILFLDDSDERISIAKKRHEGHELTIVKTAKECIEMLKYYPFDVVSLDHDLGDKHTNGTGMQVAMFIYKMNRPPQMVIIHSLNSVAAERMFDELKDVTSVVMQPFLVK